MDVEFCDAALYIWCQSERSQRFVDLSYDAAYLELAQRRGAILATFDEQLLKAAAKEKVPTP